MCVILLFVWQCEVRFNNDRSLTYSCSYSPKAEGTHKVYIRFAGREIPKSPYPVLVEGHAGDPSKVTASGPGLQPEGNMVNRPTYFDISTKGRTNTPPAGLNHRPPRTPNGRQAHGEGYLRTATPPRVSRARRYSAPTAATPLLTLGSLLQTRAAACPR